MISVVIPVYNEEQTLPEMHRRLSAAAQTWGDEWELICVDDGSKDSSLEKLQAIHTADPRVKVISFSRNFGHQTAVSAGLDAASGDAVIVIDADLQDPPEVLRAFIDKWRDGYQVVYAIRTKRKENILKRATYFAFYRVLGWLASIRIPLDSGDFCLMDRVVVDALCGLPERNRFVRGLRSWVGFKQIGITYEREARFSGQTKYSLAKLVRLALDGVISFSHRPLQVVGTIGFIVAFIAAIGVIYSLVTWLFDIQIRGVRVSSLPGYTSLILGVLFIGGLQLVALGLIGEYLGRVYDEVKGRPLYIVRRRIGFDGGPHGEPLHKHGSSPRP